MVYFLAAAASSVVFLFAGWRSKQARGLTATSASHGLGNEAEIDPSETRPQADAGAALRLALKRLAPLMANLSVQADVAASFGLMVRMRGAALADLLEEMLAAVIHAAPVSRILLTAAAHGGNVSISITDDVPNADQDLRRAGVRGLMERVAMRGGALDVDVLPDEGTTMTLRLSAASEDASPGESTIAAAFPFFSSTNFGTSR
jgi:signal transduction histidine kinase